MVRADDSGGGAFPFRLRSDVCPFLSLGRPITSVSELLDQLGCRLECVVAVQTFRDAAATLPRFVAHQAAGAASTIGAIFHRPDLSDSPAPRLFTRAALSGWSKAIGRIS